MKENEKEGFFLLEIKDFELNPARLTIILKVTPEFKSEVLDFFGVKKAMELRSLDRDDISKTAPPLIRAVDKFINNFKKNLSRSNLA